MNVEGIFDSAMKAGNIKHKKWDISQIHSQNQNLKSTCGSCGLWMTKQCPSEANFKVTDNGRICGEFVMENWVKKLIAENEEKISDLTKEINQLTP